MTLKKYLLFCILCLVVLPVFGQPYRTRVYQSPLDTVYVLRPMEAVYTPGEGAMICRDAGGASWGQEFIRLNAHGDTVWRSRHLSFDTPAGDTNYCPFYAVSLIKLPSTPLYAIVGMDTTRRLWQCVVKLFDTSGIVVKQLAVRDTGTYFNVGNQVKLVPADANSFYLIMLGEDGTMPYYRTSSTIIKYNANLDMLWKRHYYSLVHDSAHFTPLVGYSYSSAVATTDSGLVYARTMDTVCATNSIGVKTYHIFIEKLLPDGTLAYQIKLNDFYGIPDSSLETLDLPIITATNDTSVLVESLRLPTGTAMGWNGEVFKLDARGHLTDSITFYDYAHYCSMKFETPRYYVFYAVHVVSGVAIPEFHFFDKHLNYVYTLPYPFGSYLIYHDALQNEYGGGFFTFASDETVGFTGWPSAHTLVINCDSNFNVFPSTITGHLNLDSNRNCVIDMGDRALRYANTYFRDSASGDLYSAMSDLSGFYRGFVPPGVYNVTHTARSRSAFNECGGYTSRVGVGSVDTGKDFHDTLARGIRDLQLALSLSRVIPGDTSHMYFVGFNGGTELVDTYATVYIDPRMSFISSTPAPLRVSGDTIIYRLHLLPDTVAVFEIQVAADTTLTHTDTVSMMANSPYDNNIATYDDTVLIRRAVRSSYDPNEKSVNQRYIFRKENTLIYTVQYQNTGNAPARNVIVLDSLDSHLDITSVNLITGYPKVPQYILKGKDWMMFDLRGINLPDSTTNEPASHGYFMYSVRTKPTANIGDTVRNRAYIFFDYNPPVITNTTENVIGIPPTPASVVPVEKAGRLLVYPNPNSGSFRVEAPYGAEWQVSILDISGKTLQRTLAHGQTLPLVFEGSTGIYLLQLQDMATGTRYTAKVTIN